LSGGLIVAAPSQWPAMQVTCLDVDDRAEVTKMRRKALETTEHAMIDLPGNSGLMRLVARIQLKRGQTARIADFRRMSREAADVAVAIADADARAWLVAARAPREAADSSGGARAVSEAVLSIMCLDVSEPLTTEECVRECNEIAGLVMAKPDRLHVSVIVTGSVADDVRAAMEGAGDGACRWWRS
jgi:hypothetical protein